MAAFLFSWRFSHRHFKRPSIYSCRKRGLSNSYFFGPLRQAFRFTIECNSAVASRVSALLCSGGPFAIFFAVPFIIINPFYCVSWSRHYSHISNKARKLVPLRTNANTPSSVVGIRPAALAIATRLHALPRLIFWTSVSLCRMSVFFYRIPSSVAARFSISTANSYYGYNKFFSTTTSKVGHATLVFGGHFVKISTLANFLTTRIFNSFWHKRKSPEKKPWVEATVINQGTLRLNTLSVMLLPLRQQM